jgi:nicotinamidase-related amidase
MERSALLIIDVQGGLFDRPIPVYRAEELIDNINMLSAGAHKSGAPVIYIQHQNKGNLAAGTEAWQFHPGIKPSEGDLILHKSAGNAFTNRELDRQLKEMGVRRVVITGLVTHGCVKATCIGAKEAGYEVTLVSDAHSSYNANAAELIVEWNDKLGKSGVEVKPAKSINY